MMKNLLRDYFRQLKQIWIKGQPKKEITYEEVVKARNDHKKTLDELIQIRGIRRERGED